MSWTQFLLSPHGRVRRRDYWRRYYLVIFLVMLAALILLPPAPLPPAMAQAHPIAAFWGQHALAAWSGVGVVLNVPFVFVGIKRCHDLNLSGWFLLLYFLPGLGNLVILIMLGFIPGTRGPNRYGPDPRPPVPA